jgi:2-polyprenyl-3-methyl-5-hydroxy-6-metoxy-1,4-benzoquinol methylase
MREHYEYQLHFAAQDETLYNVRQREQKAQKILAILDHHLGARLDGLSLLDIGASTGIMTNALSRRFGMTVGMDIDTEAVAYANEHFAAPPRLTFCLADAMDIPCRSGVFDVVNLAHVYEHVPDASRLMAEVYRALRPGGICFFAAGNRLNLIEGHYRLPLLSVMPKSLGHLYVRLFRKAERYYETHLTFWGLRRLVSRFKVVDYTREVLRNPEQFHADDQVRAGSLIQVAGLFVLTAFYFLFPTYLWILRKGDNG